MTATRRWLETEGTTLRRQHAAAVAMRTLGWVGVATAAGVLLEAMGLYRLVAPAVVTGWMAGAAAVALGVRAYRRVGAVTSVQALAVRVERDGARRRGSVAGPAAWAPGSPSDALASHADALTAGWLAVGGPDALRGARREAHQALRLGGMLFAAGAVTAGATAPLGTVYWRPWSALASPSGAVELAVDRTEVRRGEVLTARVDAPGHRTVALWERGPGEAWAATTVPLDSLGRAAVPIGPLESDRYLRAVSGSRSSQTLHVRVQLPALLVALELVARFPAYLAHVDEPILPGEDAVVLPEGARIEVRGRVTVPVTAAAWQGSGAVVPLAVDGTAFAGTLAVRRSQRWTLAVTTEGGGSLDAAAPVLEVVAVPDSAPTVQLPVPGRDTTAPYSLRQAILIDARDDHGLRRVGLASWRVSRLGVASPAETTFVPLPAEGTDRAVAHVVLDLHERGFLPGDTAFVQAAAWDNAPDSRRGVSERYALRLPAVSEMRRDLRARTRAVETAAESLATDQEAVARAVEDFAAERERAAQQARERERSPERADELPFDAAERARELLDEEQALVERAAALREELREVADAAWAAGITDPDFHAELRDLRRLLEAALSADLTHRLDALRDALSRLDASDVRDALRQLAESATRLREELRRSRDLFERAALEGELTTLADDAEQLAAEQREWTDLARRRADSALAAAERDLARRADSLAAELERLDASLDSATGSAPGQLGDERERAGAAAAAMRDAAAAAARERGTQAAAAGAAASEALDPLAAELRRERDALRAAWRREVLAQLDRAMVETAALARRQAELGDRVDRGESGSDVRGAQAAVREGVDRLLGRLRSAAGKNALVSPQLGTALGVAQDRMNAALGELQQASPNSRQAAAFAGQALDALNGLLYALLESRAQVTGASSGSGLEEAIEQLAELAGQQGALSGSSQSLLSSMPGGDELMQRLQELAGRQLGLADALDRLRAGGAVSGADRMAEEAREIARLMEEGRLSQDLVDRQQRLFRRLLDAGRTLQSDEQDERQERVSETARPGTLRRPEPGAAATVGPRFRYPTWEELRMLSPEQRRLILEYFRRLNAGGR